MYERILDTACITVYKCYNACDCSTLDWRFSSFLPMNRLFLE
jgi:hypothetical protein